MELVLMPYKSLNNNHAAISSRPLAKSINLAVIENEQQHSAINEQSMAQEKVIATLAYFTLLGWLIAMMLYGHHKSTYVSFHLKQSLGLIITTALLSFIPLIGWGANIILGIIWLICLVNAALGNSFKAPLLGNAFQHNLDFIK